VQFHAALAAVDTAAVNVAFLGHSMVEGFSSTKYGDRSPK
jgi:hypothetical protein